MTFKDFVKEANFSLAAATSIGKKESRVQEFAKIKDVLSNTPGNTVNVLTLPYAYEYEKDLSGFTNKTIVSFGVELKQLNKVKAFAMQAAATKRIIPLLVLQPTDINNVVLNPNAFDFYQITEKGVTNKSFKLASNLDIIDLDYLGFPVLYPPGYQGKKLDTFITINKAAHLLRPGGVVCVTFMLQGMYGINFLDLLGTNDPQYRSLLDINKPGPNDYFSKDNPDPQHYAVTKPRNSAQGPTARYRYRKLATAANEYINQIIRDDAGVNLSLLWSNMYRGGASNTSIMWRGVFRKA